MGVYSDLFFCIFLSFFLDYGLVPAPYCSRGGFWNRVTITNPHGRDEAMAVAYIHSLAAAGKKLNSMSHCHSSKHRGILGPCALARSAGSEMPLSSMFSLRSIFRNLNFGIGVHVPSARQF